MATIPMITSLLPFLKKMSIEKQVVEKLGEIITGLEKAIAEQKEAINNIVHLLLDYAKDTEERLNKLAGINTNVNFCFKCGAEIEKGKECYFDDKQSYLLVCSDCWDKESSDNAEAADYFNEKVADTPSE